MLSPLDTAADTGEQERKELKVERDTYQRFGTRVTHLDNRASNHGLSAMTGGGNPDGVAATRAAHREAVMIMSHYDDVCNNTLIADIEAEFGKNVAAAIPPDTGLICTDKYREFLSSAAARRANDRDAIVDSLAEENHH